jgi:hypothetical protein
MQEFLDAVTANFTRKTLCCVVASDGDPTHSTVTDRNNCNVTCVTNIRIKRGLTY